MVKKKNKEDFANRHPLSTFWLFIGVLLFIVIVINLITGFGIGGITDETQIPIAVIWTIALIVFYALEIKNPPQ